MKLTCDIECISRNAQTTNVIASKRRCVKSTLALGKEPKDQNTFFILHFSSTKPQGFKYKVTDNIEKVFIKFCQEGKSTIRFKVPPHDLAIKADPIQLKHFMRGLRACMENDINILKTLQLSNVSVSVPSTKNVAPTKLVVSDISAYPSKGLPRTLQHLQLSHLKMVNMKSDVLLLRTLSFLDLSNNRLETLPAEVGEMPCLKELHLSNNCLGLTDYPVWHWLQGNKITSNLRLLDLRSNSYHGKLSGCVGKLKVLVTLQLDQNRITQLPGNIVKMSQLRFLTVSNNQLQHLPYGLEKLRLTHLDISSNRFTPGTMEKFVTPQVPLLVNVAGAVVLDRGLPYTRQTIPYTLVEDLNEANFCSECGKTILGDASYVFCPYDVALLSVDTVKSTNVHSVTTLMWFCRRHKLGKIKMLNKR